MNPANKRLIPPEWVRRLGEVIGEKAATAVGVATVTASFITLWVGVALLFWFMFGVEALRDTLIEAYKKLKPLYQSKLKDYRQALRR